MPVKIPDTSSLVRLGKTYVLKQEAFKKLNLSTKTRNLVLAMLTGLSLTVKDWYIKFKDYADNDPFPQTARGDFLTQGWWVDITGLTQHSETPASGVAVMTGDVGSIVLKDALLLAGNNQYRVEHSAVIIAQNLNASSLTFIDGKAVFETASDHYLASGLIVAISGADQPEYNGSFEIAVTANNEFTFEVPDTPVSPATGTIQTSANMANVNIEAVDYGQFTNIDDGGYLQLIDILSGVDDVVFTTWGGIGGGTDLEDVDDFRERILEALAATLGMFTEDEIKTVVKEVSGVTRVWVLKAKETPATGEPAEGQVKIAFMRDNDANPFPSAQEVSDVKTQLVNSIMPAHMVDVNLMVFSPTPVPVDFTFTSITPDTAGLRLAITDNLKQYFVEIANLGEDVVKYDYECAIKRSIDVETGIILSDFELSDPTDDVTIDILELSTLGTVTF